jgi:DNA polymerase III sliding clamp (beta) subunit (PCNA family)
MPTDITVIEFTKSNNPCVIKPNDDTDFIHVIMPMNVEDK